MDSLYDELIRLQYKTVTVYTTSYASSPISFSGVLFGVTPSHIRIIMKIASMSSSHKSLRINFNKRFSPSPFIFLPGSIVEIPINKIESITYYAL